MTKLPTLEEFNTWLVAFGKDQERQAFYDDFVYFQVYGTLDKLYNERDYDKALKACVDLINGELDYNGQDSSGDISRDTIARMLKLWTTGKD